MSKSDSELKSYLDQREKELDKEDVDTVKGAFKSFKKYIRKKFTEGTELHAEAIELLKRCQQFIESGSKNNASNQNAKGSQSHHQEHRRSSHTGGGGCGSRGGASDKPQAKGSSANAAAASLIGKPFHNPYTFIPFPKNPPSRKKPTPLTIDEVETDRVSGILKLTVQTLSPLMTCAPSNGPASNNATEHQSGNKALAIGKDVILPATSVRGSLRSLMSILVGGTLSYIDPSLWLCQDRDLNLGPKGKNSPQGTPENVFLAQVIKPGNSNQSGTIRLGETKLIKLEELKNNNRDIDQHRPNATQQPLPPYVDENGKLDTQGDWLLKLSGRPINETKKNEGLFKPNGQTIELPQELWEAYQGRNRHGVKPELKEGDLIWLEPSHFSLQKITSSDNIKSIQWARWGRKGQRLLDIIKKKHRAMLPDNLNFDGKVDEVTDLFGQIPMDKYMKAAGPFAARIRPENLVFKDAYPQGLTENVPLAPLLAPHPSCLAFYRDSTDPDSVSQEDGMRGYKVYRTTDEGGKKRSWHWATQGTFNEKGERDQKLNTKISKTCDLLNVDACGELRISFRALTKRELALLLATCSVDWRLGGGKPLGLGHCRVTKAEVIFEDGQEKVIFEREAASGEKPANLPDYREEVENISDRIATYHASQLPVMNLRYPRAVNENNNKKNRGGHVWFGRHATPKKNGTGLETLWGDGELKEKMGGKDQISAQLLPPFDPEKPTSDLLYGYDLFTPKKDIKAGENKINYHLSLEGFDPTKHNRETDQSSGNHSQNQETRQQQKDRR